MNAQDTKPKVHLGVTIGVSIRFFFIGEQSGMPIMTETGKGTDGEKSRMCKVLLKERVDERPGRKVLILYNMIDGVESVKFRFTCAEFHLYRSSSGEWTHRHNDASPCALVTKGADTLDQLIRALVAQTKDN